MDYNEIITLICAIAPSIAAIVAAIGTAANIIKQVKTSNASANSVLAKAVAEIKEANSKVEVDKVVAVMSQSIDENIALKRQLVEQRAEIDELKQLVKADLEKAEKKVNTVGKRSM